MITKFKVFLTIILSTFFHFSLSLFAQQILNEMQLSDISKETMVTRNIIRDPEQALLIVKSQISDLRIESNNIKIGSEKKDDGTWFIKLVPGVHLISFQTKGFISIQQRFFFNPKDVKGSRIQVISAAERREEKNTGYVVIKSKPDNAKVFFNDQFYGITPYLGKLISGRYNLELKKDLFRPLKKDIIIIPKETLPVEVLLKAKNEDSSEDSLEKKLQVAVLDFEGRGISRTDAATLTDRFRNEIVNKNEFTVLARGNMIEILNEIGFEESKCNSIECAIEAGKVLSMDKMITGSIGKIGETYTIDISLLDVETSGVDWSHIENYSGEKDGLLLLLRNIVDKLILNSKRANIVFDRLIAGTSVYVMEKLIKSEDQKYNVPIGQHSIELQKSGYEEKTFNYELQENQTKTLNGELIKKTNTNAMWRSAILPGWGQWYQEKSLQKWLYPALVGGGLLGSVIVHNNFISARDDYNKARESYLSAFSEDDIISAKTNMHKKYDEANSIKNTRNTIIALTAITWLWNIADTLILPPEYVKQTKVSASQNKKVIMFGMNIVF